jgi:hypothetical protein
MTAEDLARTLVDDYYSYYSSSGLHTTYSYINLGTPFTELKNRFTAFAEALNNTSDMSGVYNAWSDTTYFDWSENRDLYDFADELSKGSSDSNVTSAANNLKIALSSAIYYRNTGIYATSSFPAYGVSILIPSSEEWPYYSGSDQYVQLKMSKDTFWDEFIQRFVNYTSTL